MTQSFRARTVRQAAIVGVVLMAVGIALSGWQHASQQIGWVLAFSAGIAAWTAWQATNRVKKGFVAATNPGFALVPVDATRWPAIDWSGLDDRAIQLEARGYHRLGDFTTNSKIAASRGMARFLTDSGETRIVEIQQFERLGTAPGPGDDLFVVHVSIGSIVGGRIRVMVSDRPLTAAVYLVRDEEAVSANYPGKSIFELLELHKRLCDFVCERSAKSLDTGYTLERYTRLIRERQARLKARFERSSGWGLMGEVDRFNASPLQCYSPSQAKLRALETRTWAELEAGASPPVAGVAATASVPDRVPGTLREQLTGGAHWFYWIAALSAVNAVAGAMGSSWGFVIGLGITQVASAMIEVIGKQQEVSHVVLAIVWILNAGAIGLFALLGWLAQRPSVAAFAIGMALFALDTLIFLLAADWIGVGFHALALYCLGRGYSAARRIKKLSSGATAANAAAG